jgi:hypothetical protein
MESIKAHLAEKKFKPVFTLGKIHNKYLIIEILAYLDVSERIYRLLFKTNWTMRELLFLNFHVFRNMVKQSTKIPRNDFDNTAAQHYGVNFKVCKNLKAILKKDDIKVSRFKLIRRAWVSTMEHRKEVFKELAKTVKPPFMIMSHYGEKG